MKCVIKMFIMDVDGTLTDGKIYLGEDGEKFKVFNIKDGLGIATLLKVGILPVIITGRISKIVEYRAKELKIGEVYQGVKDKICIIQELLKKYDFKFSEIAYIGDDLNDVEVIKRVGISFAPADSCSTVLGMVTHICKKAGGEGAVRESIDFIIDNYYKCL